MNQHPVPQHISSYEFKLVGDMTLKQFFQLAGGAIIALIFYATPLPGILKWPLVFIFGSLGAALAFLPVEERPLSIWIFAFLKAIYSPTRFVYDAASTEDVFAKIKTQDSTPVVQNQQIQIEAVQNFETAEKNFFQKVTTLFQTPGNPIIQSQQLPNLANYQPVQPISNPTPAQGSFIEIKQFEPQKERSILEVVEEIDIPKTQSVKVETPVITQQITPTFGQQTPINSGLIGPVFKDHIPTAGIAQASYRNQSAPPSPPSIPNTITGQVLSFDGKIVDGAIMEIKEPGGKSVRAIKTNKVGHFITVTPLANGEYIIETEKEGYVFAPIKFVASGGIVPPIEIKAKV